MFMKAIRHYLTISPYTIIILLCLLIAGMSSYLILGNFSLNEAANTPSINQCNNLSLSKQQQCFQDVIDYTLQHKSLDQTFTIFETLYQTQPQFASDCHGFAHQLGEKAYDLFAAHKELKITSKTSYCGYGFYHGFMEKLLHKSGDATEARSFCKQVGAELQKESADAEGACYHGIGHGAVEDVSDPNLFGKPQAIIDPSIKLCEQVSADTDKLFRCITGIYNALEIDMSQKKYLLSVNIVDPFVFCRTQPLKYQRACFTQFVVAAMNVSGGDWNKTAQFVDTIKDDAIAQESLAGLVVEFVRMGKTDYQKTLTFCHNLPERFHLPCISGYAEGFLKYGPPKQEYVEGVKFCNSTLLTDTEKKTCFSRILSILRIWYTPEKSTQICLSIEEKYRINNCVYEN
jgi:hypothetical protein